MTLLSSLSLLCLHAISCSWLGVRRWIDFQDQISGRSAALRLLSRKPGRVPGSSDERRTAVLPVWPSGTKASSSAGSKWCSEEWKESDVLEQHRALSLNLESTFHYFVRFASSFCLIYRVSYTLPVIFLTSRLSSPSSSFPSLSLPTVFSIPCSPLINVICSPSLAPVREAGRGVKTLKVCQRLNWTAINSFPAVTTREYQLQAN